MKKLYILSRIGFLFLFIFIGTGSVFAQGSRTSYFMNSAYSHKLNPALQPHRGYIGFPGLSNLHISLGTGTTFNSLFHPLGDSLALFLHPEIKKNHDIKSLFSKKISPHINVDYSVLSFGFFSKESFISFEINSRVDAVVSIPRSILEFLDKGGQTPYGLDVEIMSNTYVENVLGYSRIIDNRLTVGAKLKYLIGAGNIDFRFKGSSITANEDIWRVVLNGKGRINGLSSIGSLIPKHMLPDEGISKYQFPEGHGVGIDLGATYEVMDNLVLSASIIDIGFISWRDDYYGTRLDNRVVEFTGVDLSSSETIDFEELFEEKFDSIYNAMILSKNSNGKRRSTSLFTTFTLGGEYRFYENKLSAGLLYRVKASPLKWQHGITSSLNYRPHNNINLALSYSFFDNWSSFGFGINYRPAYFLNVFFALDYIPLWVSTQYIPLGYQNFNLQIGLSIPLGTSSYTKNMPKSF